MRHLTLISSIAASVLMLSSCVQQSSAYKKLQAQNDSLKAVTLNAAQNMEDILDMINTVDQNFQDINNATKSIAFSKQNGELTQSNKDQIRSTMEMINETLRSNKEQIDKLNQELSKNTTYSRSLAKKIATMTRQMSEKEAMLTELRNQLAAKNIHISELDSTVNNLSENVRSLSTENTLQQQTISQQDAALNTAYYCFGSLSELKEHKIITGGGLFSSAKVLPDGFNKDYFLSIDIREVLSIPLFAKKARVRTNHPTSTYEFIKDKEGNMTLHILDPQGFWEKSKYLVVEVTL